MKQMLLGLIALFGPRTGYSLHKKMLLPLRPSLPQVYHGLKDMQNEGLIETVAKKGTVSDKKLFGLTPKGYKELEHWLKEQDDMNPMCEFVMMKMWFGSFNDVDSILDSLKSYYEFRNNEVKYYEKLKEKLRDEPDKMSITGFSDKLYCFLAIEYAIVSGRAQVSVIEDTINQIKVNADILRNLKDEQQIRNNSPQVNPAVRKPARK